MAQDTVARSIAMAALSSGGGGGSEPSAYLKSASVSNNTLTLTNKDDTTTTFTPTTDLSSYSTTTEMNTAISNHHDSTKQDVLDSSGANANVIAPLYVDTGELRIDLGNGVYKTSDDVLEVKPGTGITVNASGVNVDTTTIQPKLTAGTNITIDQTTNTISAEGGGSSYTFTNGLTESSGTVSWDLNDRIKAGTGTDSLVISSYSRVTATGKAAIASGTTAASDVIASGEGSRAFGKGYGSGGKGIVANGTGSLVFGEGGSTSGDGAIYVGSSGALAFGQSYVYGTGIAARGVGSMAHGYATGSANMNCIGAQGAGSHAEGYCDKSGNYQYYCALMASGAGSHAEGYCTQAMSPYQHAAGKFNVADTASTYAYIIGNGTDTSARSNAFTVDWSGNVVAAGTVTPSGADYAEYFEWSDGNPDNEDRMGYLVTLTDNKIVLANDSDDILGITTGTKAVIGDSQEMNWSGKYQRDRWGRILYEDVTVVHPAITDPETGEIIEPEWTETVHTPLISPEYDPTQPYTPRSKRKEWYPVGLMGKIILRDDGTAEVGNYITAVNGIGHKSIAKTNIKVLKRIDSETVQVLLK